MEMRCPPIQLMVLVLAAGCSKSEPAPMVPPRWLDGALQIGPAGGVRCAILAPRHRISSPSPPIMLFTPGDEGVVEVCARLPRGFGARLRTRERMIPWPSTWPLLKDGDSGWIVLQSSGMTARTGFIKAPWTEPTVVERGGPAGIASLAARGLPFEAALLAALDPDACPGVPSFLLMRAGLPRIGWWRER